MSEIKHSELPYDILYGYNIVSKTAGSARLVASTGGHSSSGDDAEPTNKANARFIVEACNNYESLQSRLKIAEAVLEHVVILPDDAEPEVGDLVTNIGMKAWWVADIVDDKWYAVGKEYGFLKEAKIIQRNGKPVIYESALTPVKPAKDV